MDSGGVSTLLAPPSEGCATVVGSAVGLERDSAVTVRVGVLRMKRAQCRDRSRNGA